jgi:hypothetical protein
MNKHQIIDDDDGLEDEEMLPTSQELARLYDLIAEGETRQAVELFHELFREHADLLAPHAQLHLRGRPQ